ncbi:flavin-containing monooxygenase [Trinickia mobilis]|uniref:flavin-containing monooxygenase n=1 Tax=Trinickia mobilis TaxID=2816356 RepID=UPI002867CED9|nr:NAD(P)/FAD-dependent oxidoreductase [Trinickia mobilis]
MKPRPSPRIAIVGSGFAGIGMAIHLKRLGLTSFTVYEAAHDIGGTWRDNTYPGTACDIPSHLYSFSFEPNPSWSRAFGQQHEILAYLKGCARKYAIEPFIRCNTRVEAARFDDARGLWRLELGGGPGAQDPASVEADIVIAASGALSRPAMPQIEGIERFEGKLFHSARWDHGYPLEGKTVAVIGTGASAIQFVPQIQPLVARLHLFQRTAPWIMPKQDRALGERTQRLFKRVPFTQRLVRSALYWQHESRALAFVAHPNLMKWPMKFSLSYLERRIADPVLRAKLTPNYHFGCKRVLLSRDFYPAVSQPNVDVVTTPIREIVGGGIVTDDGTHYPVDAIICGTGFQVGDAGAPFEVIGAQGADLDALWRQQGPEAYLGTSVAGFPNFFMLTGPNTGLGHNSMIYMIESQIAYIADCLRALRRRGARTMTLKHDVQRAFNERLQRGTQRSVWATGCHSWYLSGSGRNTALWPGFTFTFRRRTRRVRAADYHFAR